VGGKCPPPQREKRKRDLRTTKINRRQKARENLADHRAAERARAVEARAHLAGENRQSCEADHRTAKPARLPRAIARETCPNAGVDRREATGAEIEEPRQETGQPTQTAAENIQLAPEGQGRK
jgi:hypothetical protein